MKPFINVRTLRIMKYSIIQLFSLLVLSSCTMLVELDPEESPCQMSIPTGGVNYLPGTHVDNCSFQYRIIKIEWISVWKDDTSTVEYFYNNDLLTKIESTSHNKIYLFTYSNDTVYNGPYCSVFEEGKLISKYSAYELKRVDKYFWDDYKLVKVIWGNKEHSLTYNNDGLLIGLESSDFDYSYEYDGNTLKRIIINEMLGDNPDNRRLEYSYYENGLLKDVYTYRSYGLSTVYKFEYDDFKRLESLKYEAGQNKYEHRYHYELGKGNALYLYHPTYTNIWPFDYYIGSVLLNFPTIR